MRPQRLQEQRWKYLKLLLHAEFDNRNYRPNKQGAVDKVIFALVICCNLRQCCCRLRSRVVCSYLEHIQSNLDTCSLEGGNTIMTFFPIRTILLCHTQGKADSLDRVV